jgi:hypothetical protein
MTEYAKKDFDWRKLHAFLPMQPRKILGLQLLLLQLGPPVRIMTTIAPGRLDREYPTRRPSRKC